MSQTEVIIVPTQTRHSLVEIPPKWPATFALFDSTKLFPIVDNEENCGIVGISPISFQINHIYIYICTKRVFKKCASNNSKSLNILNPWKLMLGRWNFPEFQNLVPLFGEKKILHFRGVPVGPPSLVSPKILEAFGGFSMPPFGGVWWKAPPCHCQRWWVPQWWYKQRAPRCLRCEMVPPFESNHQIHCGEQN